MVEDAERDATRDGRVVEIAHERVGPPSTLPLPVRPIGVAAVAGPAVEGHQAERLDLDGHGLPAALAHMDRRRLGMAGSSPVPDLDLRPAQLLGRPPARGRPHPPRFAEDAFAVAVLLGDDDEREVVETQWRVRPPEAEAGVGLGRCPARRSSETDMRSPPTVTSPLHVPTCAKRMASRRILPPCRTTCGGSSTAGNEPCHVRSTSMTSCSQRTAISSSGVTTSKRNGPTTCSVRSSGIASEARTVIWRGPRRTV